MMVGPPYHWLEKGPLQDNHGCIVSGQGKHHTKLAKGTENIYIEGGKKDVFQGLEAAGNV